MKPRNARIDRAKQRARGSVSARSPERPAPSWLVLFGVAVVFLAAAVGVRRAAAVEGPTAGFRAPTDTGWVSVDYSRLLDRRRISHSGQTVGALLMRLAGRPFPRAGERPDDAALHRLLDPLLEPYAFVLPDALDSLEAAPRLPMVEVGGLWLEGEAQPAWAELLRARHFVVESDGAGRLRVFLPWADGRPGDPETSSLQAAREAWEDAWPVLRHVFASEKLRLSRKAGVSPEQQVLEVEARAYRHEPEFTRFRLGFEAYRVRVERTAAREGRRPLDLAAWQAFLDRGLSLEGGRLDPDGSVRLLGSPARKAPTVLGRPLALADFAVAYRAVFRGGAAESYMSLDRGEAPDVSNVNFGGRLQDTTLGLVSLRSDIRFKTFSLGIDVAEGRDVRDRLRGSVPGFKTHLERFAEDPRTEGLQSQQTRLWFYPDAVDVTLSEEGDILVLRRARMAAASERLAEGSGPGGGEDPPWTRDTILAINSGYDLLARELPELADLDETARLLTLFTWLRRAGAAGHPLVDLDVLLDAPLPPVPTPRRFPQLLACNVLPPVGHGGGVDVFDRTEVGAALERLRPGFGRELPPKRRLSRALAMLDPRRSDHQTLLAEVGSADPAMLDDETADFLAYRAERLFMHHLVLRTLGEEERARIESRAVPEGKPRTFSVGIGGIDLGMDQALDRALAGRARQGQSGDPGVRSPALPSRTDAPRGDDTAVAEAAPSFEMPDHGLGAVSSRPTAREFARGWIRTGSWSAPPRTGSWSLAVIDPDGPEVRSRRLILGSDGRALAFERAEDFRFLRYAMERGSAGLEAVPLAVVPGEPAPLAAKDRSGAEGEEAASPPSQLSWLEVLGDRSATGSSDPNGDKAAVALKLQMPGKKALEASFPRAILQRLVLGPALDLAAGSPLPGLTPPDALLGGARGLMVAMTGDAASPPWAGPAPVLPGEETAARLATALARWWEADAVRTKSLSPAVVVATRPGASPGRWARAPSVSKRPLLILPEDGFPGPFGPLRDALSRAWSGGWTAAALPGTDVPDLVLVASAEAPGLLGARLRALARDSRMKGKLLGVWPLAGPMRDDLPASLLDEGNFAAVGVAGFAPVGLPRVVEAIGRIAESARTAAPERSRAEEVAPDLTWFY